MGGNRKSPHRAHPTLSHSLFAGNPLFIDHYSLSTHPQLHSNRRKGRKVRQFNKEQSDTAHSSFSHAPLSSVSAYTLVRILAALTGGLILRLWMMRAFPQTNGDALIYGNIATAILQHHQFALIDGSGVLHSTLIRLPGYPLFLAACFAIFGVANYSAVGWLQIALELASCLLLADFTRRIWNERAALNSLWLAALCPFTAVFSAAPLTESLTFDCIALALWSVHRYRTGGSRGLQAPEFSRIKERGFSPGLFYLALFTFAISSAALLRPDGALLAFALWPVLLVPFRTWKTRIKSALAVGLLAILPFAVWTARNASTFHVFEPLAPRYATDPGEDPHLGFQHWVKTWCLDFTCTYEIYWNVPDDHIDLESLPHWAWDSEAQRQQTAQLFADYNRDPQLTPALDVRFQQLASTRAHDHPLLVHILLPLGRLTDMLFRPRVENLNIDLRWWQYYLHHVETRFSYTYAALNLILFALGLYAFRYRPPYWQSFAAYFLLRAALLATIEAPETRYTLEYFPMLFVLGGITLRQLFTRNPDPHSK